jgi:hypothetical protein
VNFGSSAECPREKAKKRRRLSGSRKINNFFAMLGNFSRPALFLCSERRPAGHFGF